MSHVSAIELEIKDLDALKAACERLGLKWQEGKTTYRWFGTWMGDYPMPEGFTVEDLGKCNHAISVPKAAYEIGVVIRNVKTTLLWDFWESGGLEKVLGKRGGKLKQAYAVETAKRAAKKAGYRVQEKRTLMDRFRGALGMQQVDGIRLTLRRY
jgi:hypothetical protein